MHPLVNNQFSLFEVMFCKVTINTELLVGEIQGEVPDSGHIFVNQSIHNRVLCVSL